MPRKRPHAEVDAEEPPPQKHGSSLVQRIQNMWEFAAFMQYIFMFGKVMKIDEDFDIEDLENECLKPGYSDKLEEIGLQLLRFVSSNRGLNFDNWDEYVRRQYQSKAPTKRHPYGDAEEPAKFRSFDIFTKIRTLHQLSIWTFWNADRIRGTMPDAKESEQLDWRMNVFGWDEDDREYFVLDDNRLYRRTEPPLPPAPKAKLKANSLKARAARRRASKRRKIDEVDADTETQDEEEETSLLERADPADEQDPANIDTYGGYKWECVAITLDEYQSVIVNLKTSVKNYPNERAMRARLIDEVLPTIRELAEKQRRKQERRERDLMMMERMAGAKRSSRLADKHDKERKEQEEAETARKREADLVAARKDQERQAKMEEERQFRMMTREQRIKDREYKRLLMEVELARDAEEQKRIEEGEKRGSERHIRDRIEKNKKELEDLENEEDWTFDCAGCGVHGKNIDDGSHSIACEKCNVWQHSKCLGISKSAAEKDDFSFVCSDCRQKERQAANRKEEEARRREEEANKPKIMLKFSSGPSSSPPQLPAQPIQPQAPQDLQSVNIRQSPLAQRPSPRPPVNGSQHSPTPQTQSHVPQLSSHQPLLNGLSSSHHRPQPILTPALFKTTQQPGTTAQAASISHPHSVNEPARSQTHGNGTVVALQHEPEIPASLGTQQSHPADFLPAMQSTPLPPATQEQQSRSGRLPSPILNRPRMSPTQGNPEVGPIAGVPNSSPRGYHPELFTPQSNGTSRPFVNGSNHPGGPSSSHQGLSSTPQPQQLSGLSPVKQRSPRPNSYIDDANIRSKTPDSTPQPLSFGQQIVSSTPSNSFPSKPSSFKTTSDFAAARSVSGTPIFPLVEKLVPSPEHANRGPVPTPSKQPSSSPTASFEMQGVIHGNGGER